MILIIVIIILSFFIGQDIIYKQSPISFQQDSVYNQTQLFNLNSSIFPLAFAVMDWDNNILQDDTIFKISMVYSDLQLTEGQSSSIVTEIPLANCNKTDFPSISSGHF